MYMIETLLNHRTIRKYKSDSIPEPILNEILLAASRASTTGNMQVYSIIVSTGEELRKQLCALHFNQKMVEQAPVILTFCADFNRFNQWCRLREAQPGYDNFLSFFTAAIDALLAAQNAAIAAEANGLGICYLGTTTYQAGKISELLALPKDVVPVTTLVVGYPDEQVPLTDRLPMRAVVHQEKYQLFTDEEINELYCEKENLPQTKDLLQANELPNLARIFTDKRYTKKDNLHFSKLFLEAISSRGFGNNEPGN
jgi:nitroreductase